MRNCVLTVVAAGAVLLGFSAPAGAQTTTMPTFELGAGYQWLHAGEVCDPDDDSDCSDGYSFPFGLAVDGVWNRGANGLGLVAEAGWSRDSEDFSDILIGEVTAAENLFHFGAGVRWTGRTSPRFWPYGQVIAGAIVNRISESYEDDLLDEQFGFSDTRTRFMVQPGVGATFVAGDGWGVFGQVDYRRLFLDEDEDFGSGRNDFRVYIGARMILD